MEKKSNLQDLETEISKNNKMMIQKNDKDNIIIMGMKEYNKRIMEKNIIKKLKQSEKEIENGEGIDSDIFLERLKTEFGY